MSCDCNRAQGKIKNVCGANTPPVLEVNAPECPVLFHTVNIPASAGDPTTIPPTVGLYKNVRLTYEATGDSYLYDSDGIPQLLSNGGGGAGAVESVNGKTGEVVLDANDVGAATPYDISGLQNQIDALSAASDVTDIVGTYADLQSYDTSKLKDNDIIKVLDDEDQDNQTTYYRWDNETESFTLIGAEGPYYTKSAADTKFQDKLTAGTNIQISGNTISATDTTYSNFVGTDGVDAGTAGLVPAPATTDAGKFLKADGTWDTAGGTLYTTYGQNEDGAMTQKATTDLVYTAGDPKKINIGDNGVTGGTNSIIIGSEDSGTITGAADQVIIGHNITDSASESVAVGHDIIVGPNCVAVGRHTETGTTAAKAYGVAIGYYSKATGVSSVAIGSQKNASGSSSIIIGGGMGGSASADYAIVIGDGGCQSQYGISIGHNAGGRNGVQSAICVGNSTDIHAKRKSDKTYYTEGGVALGSESIASQTSVAVGAKAGYEGKNVDPNKRFTVALGSYSLPRAEGVVDVSLSGRPNSSADYYGYDGSVYRVISGVHDGEQLHDAATVAQGNTLATSAPTTATVGVLGQLYTDTTNMHTYQCTAIDTTDPSNPSYSWTQRW